VYSCCIEQPLMNLTWHPPTTMISFQPHFHYITLLNTTIIMANTNHINPETKVSAGPIGQISRLNGKGANPNKQQKTTTETIVVVLSSHQRRNQICSRSSLGQLCPHWFAMVVKQTQLSGKEGAQLVKQGALSAWGPTWNILQLHQLVEGAIPPRQFGTLSTPLPNKLQWTLLLPTNLLYWTISLQAFQQLQLLVIFKHLWMAMMAKYSMKMMRRMVKHLSDGNDGNAFNEEDEEEDSNTQLITKAHVLLMSLMIPTL
jgi:hypothetical protein